MQLLCYWRVHWIQNQFKSDLTLPGICFFIYFYFIFNCGFINSLKHLHFAIFQEFIIKNKKNSFKKKKKQTNKQMKTQQKWSKQHRSTSFSSAYFTNQSHQCPFLQLIFHNVISDGDDDANCYFSSTTNENIYVFWYQKWCEK